MSFYDAHKEERLANCLKVIAENPRAKKKALARLLDSLCSEWGYCYNNSHDSKLGWPGLEFTVFITINLEGSLS